jgi:glutaredoxin 3
VSIAAPDVRIYTTTFCGYCVAAKRLLGARGVAYEEIDVTGDHAKRAWLVEATRRRTVPQIFIHDQAIGGYEELAALDRQGKLKELLAGPAP